MKRAFQQHRSLEYPDIIRSMSGFRWEKHEDGSRTLLIGNPVCSDEERSQIRGIVYTKLASAGIDITPDTIGTEKQKGEAGWEHSRVKITLPKEEFHKLLRHLSHETSGGLHL